MLESLWDGVEIIRDKKHDACETLRRVLNTNESVLVMEDDLELCKDFLEKAKKEINQRPDSFIMFYSCKGWELAEAVRKERGLPFNRPYVYTQAYYVPAWIGKRLAEFLKTNEKANNKRYSVGINEFLVNEWVDRYLVQPSLVQHISTDSVLEPWMWEIHHSVTYKYE